MQQQNLNLTTTTPKVLAIDDCIDSIRLLSTILSHYHCELDLAFDGQDAIPLLQSQNFDLVILDWQMPKMGGHETLLLLEQIVPPSKKKFPTPVLLYTSSHYSHITLPELRQFKYAGWIDKQSSFPMKFRSIGNALALI